MATPKSEVFDLQNMLNKYKYPDSDGKPLKVDGKLGPKTDSAVMGAVDDLSPKAVVPKTTDYKFKTLKNDSFEQEYENYNAFELLSKAKDPLNPFGGINGFNPKNPINNILQDNEITKQFNDVTERYNSLNQTDKNNVNDYLKGLGYDVNKEPIKSIMEYASKNNIDSQTAIQRLSKINNPEKAKSVYAGIRGIAEAYGKIEWDGDTQTTKVKLFDGSEYSFKPKDGKGTFIGSDNKMYVSVLPNSNGVGYNLPSLSGNPNTDLFLYKALGEVGYKEKGINSTKYGDWYYGNEVEGENYMWCATFLAWCANETGIMNSIVPKYEGCWGGRDYYEKNNMLHSVKSGYEPKAGDVFFEEYDHTGIVLAYDPKNKVVYTIEGNYSQGVGLTKHNIDDFSHFGSNGGITFGIVPTNIVNDNGTGSIT